MYTQKRIHSQKESCKKISRKQAIKKVGITALTSASLLFLETPAAAQTSTKRLLPRKPGRS